MRRDVLLIVLLLSPICLFAQGAVRFQNSTNNLVYLDYAGGQLAGPEHLAGLYYAPDGTMDESAFIMLSPTAIINAGLFSGGVRTSPNVLGTYGLFQVRIWTSAFGSDYNGAVALGDHSTGKSNILRFKPADPTKSPPEPPTDLAIMGLQPMVVVPEPRIWMIWLFGIGSLAFVLRAGLRG